MHLVRFWTSFCSTPQRMATTHPLPPPVSAPSPTHVAAGAAAKEAAGPAQQALVPCPHPPAEEQGMELTAPVARLPVELDVAIPVRPFRVRNLLALDPGQVIETAWAHGEDMPLAAGEVQLAWSEFEVVESKLAVRLTRLT